MLLSIQLTVFLGERTGSQPKALVKLETNGRLLVLRKKMGVSPTKALWGVKKLGLKQAAFVLAVCPF